MKNLMNNIIYRAVLW